MAREPGLEPGYPVLETGAFPLSYSPIGKIMVREAGFEPATYRLSTDCSTAELHAHLIW